MARLSFGIIAFSQCVECQGWFRGWNALCKDRLQFRGAPLQGKFPGFARGRWKPAATLMFIVEDPQEVLSKGLGLVRRRKQRIHLVLGVLTNP